MRVIIFVIVFLVSLYTNVINSSYYSNNRLYFKYQVDMVRYKESVHLITKIKEYSSYRLTIEEATYLVEKRNEMNIYLLVGLISSESSFKKDIVSPKNCIGLGQINPIWVEKLELNSVNELYNSKVNIDCIIKIYKKYLELADGNSFKALVYYTNGQNRKTPEHKYAIRIISKAIEFERFVER